MKLHNNSRYLLFTLISGALIGSLTLSSCKRDGEPATKTDSTSTSSSTSTTTTPGSTTTAPGDTSAKASPITGKALEGQKIFYNASFGQKKITCASCHTDGQPTTQDTRIRQGHTLAGVASRTSTWNGMFKGEDLKKKAYGAALCAAVYQKKADGNVDKALSASEAEALNAYFEAINGAPGAITKNINIQWGSRPAFNENEEVNDKEATASVKPILKLPGDPANGKALFSRTCGYCHTYKEKKAGPALSEAFNNAEFAAKVVRTGSGSMAFYGKDVLNDQQVADILAHIQEEISK